jgi:hypothetical protein
MHPRDGHCARTWASPMMMLVRLVRSIGMVPVWPIPAIGQLHLIDRTLREDCGQRPCCRSSVLEHAAGEVTHDSRQLCGSAGVGAMAVSDDGHPFCARDRGFERVQALAQMRWTPVPTE